MGAFCSCFCAHEAEEVTPSSSLADSNNHHQHPNTRVLSFFHRCSLVICPLRVWIVADEVATGQQPEATDSSLTQTYSIQIAQGTLDSAAHDSDSSEEECPTCFENYTDENPKITAECSHHFHLPCILEWQQISAECPNCRRVLIIKDVLDL